MLTELDLGFAPRYQQVRADLRRRIETGDWQPGQQIPPEPVLMRQFGVSRGTVRQAIDALVRHGFVQRQQGRGTFVSRTPLAAGLGDFFHFLEDLRRRGFDVDLRLIQRRVGPADASAARLLDLAVGTPLVMIRRLVLLDGEPFRLDDYYLSHARFGSLLEDDMETNYISVLLENRYGIRLSRQQKWLEPIALAEEEAQHLNVPPGEPALLIESLAHGVDTSGGNAGEPGIEGMAADQMLSPPVPVPVEFRRMYMRGDKCRFFVEIERA